MKMSVTETMYTLYIEHINYSHDVIFMMFDIVLYLRNKSIYIFLLFYLEQKDENWIYIISKNLGQIHSAGISNWISSFMQMCSYSGYHVIFNMTQWSKQMSENINNAF